MPLHIDVPRDTLVEAQFAVAGWFAGRETDLPLVLVCNGREVDHVLVDRPDVRKVLPEFEFVTGFATRCNVVLADDPDAVEIELKAGQDVHTAKFALSGDLKALCTEEARLSSKSRAWCLDHLVCPVCRVELRLNDKLPLSCARCGTSFEDGSAAINMISGPLRAATAICPTANISSNPYEPLALDLIRSVTAEGGWVLDAGAGSRHRRTENVVNVEIVDYPSTDVLAVGEALPFADNSFDGAVSLAVLEHVKDPFACAKELLRVVKPGGRIVCSVPFLQPLHGYPHHYYNMTQDGLCGLFQEGGRIIQSFVPLHGHPIFCLQWFVREYLEGLPSAVATNFGKMTLAEVASLRPHDFLYEAAAAELRPQAWKGLACLNSVVVEKRCDEPA